MTPGGLPSDNPTASFWTSEPHHLDDFQSAESLPDACDVLVVGCGFAGIGTVYHMWNDGHRSRASGAAMPTTVMLEARKLVSGATARNGGHIKPDTFMDVTKKAKLYGLEQAAMLQTYETRQIYFLKRLVEEEGLDCDFQITRACDAILDPEVAKQKIGEYQDLVRGGVVDTSDIGYVTKRDAERVSGVRGAQCAFTFTAGHLWPRKMLLQLLDKLLKRMPDLQVHAHTPVLGVCHGKKSSQSWEVRTPRGTITAKKVVWCTNGYTSTLLPQFKNKIIPVRGVCSRLDSSKGSLTPHLPSTYSLRFDPLQFDYMIPRTDGSIIVGGARAAFWHRRDSWWHNQDDHEQVEGTAEYFENYMQRYFHGWEDSGAKLHSIWTGSELCLAHRCLVESLHADHIPPVMGYSSDLMPHVGQLPQCPGMYICAGFSGHGMPQIFSASKGVAQMVLRGTTFEDTALPPMFKATQARLESTSNAMEDGLKAAWERPRAKL